MSGKVFARKRALPGRKFVRNFVRKGFCQETGSARKGESALELGVKLFVAAVVVVVAVAVVAAVCFCFGGAGGQSASGL